MCPEVNADWSHKILLKQNTDYVCIYAQAFYEEVKI